MILTIKAKLFELLPGERIRITTDCESLREALGEHSPNILIDHLNEQYHTAIARLTPPSGGWGYISPEGDLKKGGEGC